MENEIYQSKEEGGVALSAFFEGVKELAVKHNVRHGFIAASCPFLEGEEELFVSNHVGAGEYMWLLRNALEKEQEQLVERIEALSEDLESVHKTGKEFNSLAVAIEKLCVGKPKQESAP